MRTSSVIIDITMMETGRCGYLESAMWSRVKKSCCGCVK
jgi:hypothetical protein